METEPRKAIRVQHVGPGEDRDAGSVEQSYQLDLLRIDSLAPRKIRCRHGLEPEVIPRIPTVSHFTRHVLEPGIRGKDAVIQGREGVEHSQRRHLPSTVTRELSGKSPALVGAV